MIMNNDYEYQSGDYGDLVLYLILKIPGLLLKSIPVCYYGMR